MLALGGERGFGSRTMRSIQELAKNVRGGVIERCEHWLAEERPKYLIEQLLRFFGEEEGDQLGTAREPGNGTGKGIRDLCRLLIEESIA